MIDKLFTLIEAPLVWLSSQGRRPAHHSPRANRLGFGTDLDSGEVIRLDPADLSRHCYLLGATGCGKTTLILQLIEADIRAERTIVVVDLRGDLVFGVLGLCEALDIATERVTLLDLREKERTQGFNPLGGAGEPYIRALHLLDVVASEAASWGVQLEETLRSALLLLAASSEPLTRLEDVFYNDSFRASCLRRVQDDQVAGFWERYASMSLEKRQVWALPVLNKVTSLLAVPVLRQVLGSRSPMDLGETLADPGRVVLISLAVDELQRSGRMLGSLLVSAIAREMLARVDVAEKDRNPVRLYIDEFENMASESFENLIAEGRRFKLSLCLSHQTLVQLPSKLRSVVRNNVGIQILFQCGFEDAQAVSRELPESVGAANLRSLKTGEAFVMYRDGETFRVQFNPPFRKPSNRRATEFRNRVLAAVENASPSTVDIEEPQVVDRQLDLEDLL